MSRASDAVEKAAAKLAAPRSAQLVTACDSPPPAHGKGAFRAVEISGQLANIDAA